LESLDIAKRNWNQRNLTHNFIEVDIPGQALNIEHGRLKSDHGAIANNCCVNGIQPHIGAYIPQDITDTEAINP
jgi:hypothetical protein